MIFSISFPFQTQFLHPFSMIFPSLRHFLLSRIFVNCQRFLKHCGPPEIWPSAAPTAAFCRRKSKSSTCKTCRRNQRLGSFLYISLDNRQDSWVDSWVGSSLQKGHLDPQEIQEISPERVGSFRKYVPLRLHTVYFYICFFVFLFVELYLLSSTCFFICFLMLFVYWFIYPPIHPSIDPSINLHNCCV